MMQGKNPAITVVCVVSILCKKKTKPLCFQCYMLLVFFTFSRTCIANTGPSCACIEFFRVFPCQMYTFPLAPPENTRSGPLPYVTHIIVSAFPALPNVPRLDVKPPPVCVQNLMCFMPAVTRRSGFCGFHFITNILSL